MNEKRLLRLIGRIDGRFISEADPTAARSRRIRPVLRRAALLAAALVLAIAGGAVFESRVPGVIPAAQAAYEPDFTTPYDGAEIDKDYLEALRLFAARAGAALLDGERTTAYSPAALYTALSMTAEMTAGEYRESVLKTLGVKKIDALRQNSVPFWRSLCADPALAAPGKVLVANSLWLNREYAYRHDTLKTLADNYCAASYMGDMQTEIPQMARLWVEDKTGGLLSCELHPDPDTLAALLSTFYFYDDWAQRFHEGDISSGSFWKTPEERVSCNYMERTQRDWRYYRADGVTASAQYFAGGSKMLFILPDEGRSVDEILKDEALLTRLFHWEESELPTAKVEWLIPRFQLKDTIDLREGLTALGLGGLFEKDPPSLNRLALDVPAYIGSAEQGTAIAINEDGCEAASYVQIMVASAGAPFKEEEESVEMRLSRPFAFAILSANDVPLFLGAVNDPNG